jgi:iron uptake system component EfeO
VIRRIFLLIGLLPLAGLIWACGGDDDSKPETTVDVALQEWTVSPSVASVEAGEVTFVVTNGGTMVHELAVVQVDPDGNRREVAEIEDVTVGSTLEFTADLEPGNYELACLLVPGEAGSTEDHYQQGMHTAFTVE